MSRRQKQLISSRNLGSISRYVGVDGRDEPGHDVVAGYEYVRMP
jgi:hypothetical protein